MLELLLCIAIDANDDFTSLLVGLEEVLSGLLRLLAHWRGGCSRLGKAARRCCLGARLGHFDCFDFSVSSPTALSRSLSRAPYCTCSSILWWLRVVLPCAAAFRVVPPRSVDYAAAGEFVCRSPFARPSPRPAQSKRNRKAPALVHSTTTTQCAAQCKTTSSPNFPFFFDIMLLARRGFFFGWLRALQHR